MQARRVFGDLIRMIRAAVAAGKKVKEVKIVLVIAQENEHAKANSENVEMTPEDLMKQI